MSLKLKYVGQTKQTVLMGYGIIEKDKCIEVPDEVAIAKVMTNPSKFQIVDDQPTKKKKVENKKMDYNKEYEIGGDNNG